MISRRPSGRCGCTWFRRVSQDHTIPRGVKHLVAPSIVSAWRRYLKAGYLKAVDSFTSSIYLHLVARSPRKQSVESGPSSDDPVDGRRLIASNLRSLRLRIGLSQEALAGRARIHRTYVGSVERAERNISVDLICRLALALSVHPKELLTSLVESSEDLSGGASARAAMTAETPTRKTSKRRRRARN